MNSRRLIGFPLTQGLHATTPHYRRGLCCASQQNCAADVAYGSYAVDRPWISVEGPLAALWSHRAAMARARTLAPNRSYAARPDKTATSADFYLGSAPGCGPRSD